eukprot:10897-Heterococcus_DN1.PRE.3
MTAAVVVPSITLFGEYATAACVTHASHIHMLIREDGQCERILRRISYYEAVTEPGATVPLSDVTASSQ